jgi:4'-phosphopantetheinyl transferase
MSRADGLVIVAVSDANPVGVDIEPIDAARFSGFADVALHPAEHASTVDQQAIVWTRKESLLKATGEGLYVDPRSIRVSHADQPARLLEWSGRDVPVVQMYDLRVPGYAACVTVLADLAVEVTTRQAAPAGPSD